MAHWSNDPGAPNFGPPPQLPASSSTLYDSHSSLGNFLPRESPPNASTSYTASTYNNPTLDWSSMAPPSDQEMGQLGIPSQYPAQFPSFSAPSAAGFTTKLNAPLDNVSMDSISRLNMRITTASSAMSPSGTAPLALDASMGVHAGVARGTTVPLLTLSTAEVSDEEAEDEEEEEEEYARSTLKQRHPNKPVAVIRQRRKLTESQKTAAKLTTQINKEKNQCVMADVVSVATGRIREANTLAEKHSVCYETGIS
ncbi:hypothetical protein HWV62_13633 [Athelia sp. TMB]|nr:hypothetical protein HWV62_13633 [Athelia sp. TMB]